MTRPRPEIERALGVIGSHLAQPLSVADVARAARMSEFHFQRAFHEALSETLGQFVTRKRLETAALRLAYEPATSITEIALSSGKLPAQVNKLLARYGKSFDPRALYTLPEELDAKSFQSEVDFWNERVRFETSSGLHLACLASPGAYDLPALHATWAELIARGRQLGICDDEVDAWGLALDSPDLTAPERCRYHACVPCPAGSVLPPPLFPGIMEAGRYAVFRYAGPVAGVSAAYRSIYSCWFRASSVLADDFAPFDH